MATFEERLKAAKARAEKLEREANARKKIAEGRAELAKVRNGGKRA